MTEYGTLDGDDHFNMFSRVCSTCIHFTKGWPKECDAFPNGIPKEIWMGQNNHTQPYEGDQGIQYERRLPKEVA